MRSNIYLAIFSLFGLSFSVSAVNLGGPCDPEDPEVIAMAQIIDEAKKCEETSECKLVAVPTWAYPVAINRAKERLVREQAAKLSCDSGIGMPLYFWPMSCKNGKCDEGTYNLSLQRTHELAGR